MSKKKLPFDRQGGGIMCEGDDDFFERVTSSEKTLGECSHSLRSDDDAHANNPR
jgi:hypothetical protein